MRRTGDGSAESSWLYAIAGALMGGGPVWRFLYVNHYPFGQPEAIALPVVAALIGATVAVLGHRIGGVLESLGFGAGLYLFADLQFDLEKVVPSALILGGCLAVSFLIRPRRAALTGITLGVFYLASLPRGGATAPILAAAPPATADLPLLVHVVLDEQWGVGGLRAEGDSATAAFLTAFYRERGFEFFEAAYSRSGETVASLASTLSLGQPPAYNPKEVAPHFHKSLRTIPYFDRLRSAGYAIYVYQSTQLDYCHAAAPVTGCETQPSNSIANTGHLPGDWPARAVRASRYFLTATSHVYARAFPTTPAGWFVAWTHAVTGGGLVAVEHAREAILGRPRGNRAFFVHVLLPHRPIDVDAECRILGDRAARATHATIVNPSDSQWRETLAYEGDQIRCAHRALDELLAAVDSTVGRDHSIIIVQGDHGSRLNRNPLPSRLLATLDRRALNSQFSTVLAIRRPEVPGAVYSEPVPVQDFLWKLIGNDFKGSVNGPWRHFVQDSGRADTLRSLAVGDMLWARVPARPTAAAGFLGARP